jgi:CRP-like cAMP-binding protein
VSQSNSMPAELLRLELFRGLSAADVAPLCAPTLVQDFPTGAVVFRQGDAADHLLLVVEGQLRAWAEVGGRSEPVADVFAGELVGEAALFRAAGQRTATLKAAEPTRAIRLTRDSLDDLSGSRVLAVLQRQMLVSTARRLRTTNHAMRRVWKRVQAAEAERRAQRPQAAEEAPTKGLWGQFLQALGGLS